MEIDISNLMQRKEDMKYYSASQAEFGPDAGHITWENAVCVMEDEPLLTLPEQIAEAKDYFRGFGAWEDDELDAFSDLEVNTLLLQLIAGDIRERDYYEEKEKLEKYEDECFGRIYASDDGKWWYYLGN